MANPWREVKLKWLGSGVLMTWSPEKIYMTYDEYLQDAFLKHLQLIIPPGMYILFLVYC